MTSYIRYAILHASNRSCKRTEVGFYRYSILRLKFIKVVSLTEMQKGTIARLTDRGFGFITQEGAEKDLFFHANELQGVDFNDLREGDELTFEIADGPKGQSATNISKA